MLPAGCVHVFGFSRHWMSVYTSVDPPLSQLAICNEKEFAATMAVYNPVTPQLPQLAMCGGKGVAAAMQDASISRHSPHS